MRKPMQPTKTATKFTLTQAQALLGSPQGCKYLCPVCQEFKLEIKPGNKTPFVVTCYSPTSEDERRVHSAAVFDRIIELLNKKIKQKEKSRLLPLTVAEYASDSDKGKDLPEDFLRGEWDLEDGFYFDSARTPCVIVPFPNGTKQFRFANTKHTEKGKSLCLYGTDRLNVAEVGDYNYCWLVEGASNTQTLDYAGQPVLGSPSCHWKTEFAEQVPLRKGQVLLVTQDPPTERDPHTGRDFVQKVANSFPKNGVLAVKFWYLDDQGKVQSDKERQRIVEVNCDVW